VIIRFRVCAPK